VNVERSSAPARRSLVSRLVVGAAAIGCFSALAWADATAAAGAPTAAWLLPVALVAATGGGAEVVRLAAARGIVLAGWLVPLGAAAITAAPALAVWSGAARTTEPLAPLGGASVACATVLGIFFGTEVVRYTPGGGALLRAGTSALAAIAIGLPLAFVVALRLVAPGASGWKGLLPLVSLIAVVKASDIAAYAVGSLVGRHRMAPVVSPGKTWEGAAAALVAAVAVAWLVCEWAAGTGPKPAGGWAVFGVAVGLAGIAGDLSESLVKRDLRAKDSGAALGGMGGFLDLVDSLLLAAPVAWVLWTLGG
jgi:phosphatidate cytidylyltransferase